MNAVGPFLFHRCFPVFLICIVDIIDDLIVYERDLIQCICSCLCQIFIRLHAVDHKRVEYPPRADTGILLLRAGVHSLLVIQNLIAEPVIRRMVVIVSIKSLQRILRTLR